MFDQTIAADKTYDEWATSDGLNQWFSTKNKAEVTDGGRYSNADGELGVIFPGTPIITTVHPLQIDTGRISLAPHDIPVDFIVYP